MSAENLIYLDYILMALSGVIAFLAQNIFSMRRELSEVKATQEIKKEDLAEVKEKMDTLCDNVSHIKGKIDEHLRKQQD